MQSDRSACAGALACGQDLEGKLLANFAVVVPGKKGKDSRLISGPLLKLPPDVQVRIDTLVPAGLL